MMKLPGTIRNIIGKKIIAVLLLIAIGVGTVLLSGCDAGNTNSQDNHPPSALPDITEDYYQNIIDATGINFKHSIGDDQLTNLVESVGGGAAFFGL